MDRLEEGLQHFSSANWKDFIGFSEVPETCRSEPCALGIDEAGRGPVLGPMVYGICYCPVEKVDELKSTGCADSKTLSEKQREEIFVKLCENGAYVGWAIHILSPNTICNGMYRRQKCSLNQLSHDSAIGLVKKALEEGVNVTQVFVDTVGPADKYQAKLELVFPELKITVSKKADALFPTVSAASICAKVARDRAVSGWKFPEEIQMPAEEGWGSGYPGDPQTKKFLSKNIDPVFGFPSLVRFSWSTAEKILEEKAAKVTWEETDDGQETDNSIPSLLSFFARQPSTTKKHEFFESRSLKGVGEL